MLSYYMHANIPQTLKKRKTCSLKYFQSHVLWLRLPSIPSEQFLPNFILALIFVFWFHIDSAIHCQMFSNTKESARNLEGVIKILLTY